MTGAGVTSWGIYPTLTECWPFGRSLCQVCWPLGRSLPGGWSVFELFFFFWFPCGLHSCLDSSRHERCTETADIIKLGSPCTGEISGSSQLWSSPGSLFQTSHNNLHFSHLDLLHWPLLYHCVCPRWFLSVNLSLLCLWTTLSFGADVDSYFMCFLLPHNHGADVLLWNNLPFSKTKNEKQVNFFIDQK